MLPIIPTDPDAVTIHELSGNNSDRPCKGCGDRSDFYVFADDESVGDVVGVEIPTDSWPVNAMLCRSCFADSPRVAEIGHHPDVWGEL